MQNESLNTLVHLIQTHLQAHVPLEIARIEQRGGITEADVERARGYALDISAHGDALLFQTKGQSGQIMTKLAEGLAVLSYCPGGVTAFGLHFDGPEIATRLRLASTLNIQEEEA